MLTWALEEKVNFQGPKIQAQNNFFCVAVSFQRSLCTTNCATQTVQIGGNEKVAELNKVDL